MKRAKKYKQHDISDCGVAALASIAAWYGLKMPLAHIRNFSATNKEGTSVQGLIDAAEQMGMSAKALRAPQTEQGPDLHPLSLIPKPAILHVVKENRLLHFVVLYRAGKKHFHIMDPADGRMHKVSPQELQKSWTGVLLLLAPGSSFEKGNHTVPHSQRLRQLMRPHQSDLIKAVVGALIYTFLGICTSLFVQQIVDRVLPDSNHNLLRLLGCIMMVIIAFSLFIGYFRSLILLRTGLKTDARLIMGYYQHLLHLPQSFFDQRQSGELISRINDAFKIRAFITENLVQLAVCLFSLLFAAGLMFTYYWKLALLSFGILPLYLIIYLWFNKVNKGTQRKAMVAAAQMEATLVESLRGARSLKSFHAENQAILHTERDFVHLARTLYTAGKNNLLAGQSGDGVSKALGLMILWAGSYFVLGSQLSAGALMSFYTLTAYFSGPITQLIGMNVAFRNARIAAERLFEIMDLEREDAQEGHPVSASDLGDIRFENISFKYPGRGWLFQNFSLTLPQGQITAIAGESGSGKTTLASLVLQLYRPQQGQIRVGKLHLGQVCPQDWRGLISVVPQKVELFNGSLLENISLGYDSPDARLALDICHRLGLGEFIDSLPQGIMSPVGEQGSKLSGGQQQRLALARALYRKPSILVLDEATSSLDSASETEIQKALEQLRAEGCTIMLIAHRISSLRMANHIVLLQEGRIAEQGSHQILLQQKGVYAAWCQKQADILG
jgi:ABC-type bacteriocin/lantibiotic exporters, contain an N-terminal double-glycine peptidase domain